MDKSDCSQVKIFLDLSREEEQEDLHLKGILAAYKYKTVFGDWKLNDLHWDKINSTLLDGISQGNIFERIHALNRMTVKGSFKSQFEKLKFTSDKLLFGQDAKLLTILKFISNLPYSSTELVSPPNDFDFESWKQYAISLDDHYKKSSNETTNKKLTVPIKTSTPISHKSPRSTRTGLSISPSTKSPADPKSLNTSSISSISTQDNVDTGVEVSTNAVTSDSKSTSIKSNDSVSKKRLSEKIINNFIFVKGGCSQDVINDLMNPKNCDSRAAFKMIKKLDYFGYVYIIDDKTGINGSKKVSRATGFVNVLLQGLDSLFENLQRNKIKSLTLLIKQENIYNELKSFNTGIKSLSPTGCKHFKKVQVYTQDILVTILFVDESIKIPLMNIADDDADKLLKDNTGHSEIHTKYKGSE